MIAILLTLGPRDVLTVDGAALLAERAGVSVGDVRRVEGLAEQALSRACGGLSQIFAEGGDFLVGCSRPRAVRALLDLAGVAHRFMRISWVALPFDRDALKLDYGVPWYPVIDRSRCSGCGTCHDYCLFSVYSQEKGEPAAERVHVSAPLHCKTGCPACARLCPEAALIFPFCHEPELNGEAEEPSRRSLDGLSEALGGDPMRLLAERRARKGLIDREKFVQAEKDRVLYSGVL